MKQEADLSTRKSSDELEVHLPSVQEFIYLFKHFYLFLGGGLCSSVECKVSLKVGKVEPLKVAKWYVSSDFSLLSHSSATYPLGLGINRINLLVTDKLQSLHEVLSIYKIVIYREDRPSLPSFDDFMVCGFVQVLLNFLKCIYFLSTLCQ